jgi:hypothetical protein
MFNRSLGSYGEIEYNVSCPEQTAERNTIFDSKKLKDITIHDDLMISAADVAYITPHN